jgi:hypothetical protein
MAARDARLAAARNDLPASDAYCMAQTRLACNDACGEHYSDGLIVGIAHAFGLTAAAN